MKSIVDFINESKKYFSTDDLNTAFDKLCDRYNYKDSINKNFKKDFLAACHKTMEIIDDNEKYQETSDFWDAIEKLGISIGLEKENAVSTLTHFAFGLKK